MLVDKVHSSVFYEPKLWLTPCIDSIIGKEMQQRMILQTIYPKTWFFFSVAKQWKVLEMGLIQTFFGKLERND